MEFGLGFQIQFSEYNEGQSSMNDRKRDFINSQIFDTNNDHLTRDRTEHFSNTTSLLYLFERNIFQALERLSHLALPLLVALPDFDRRRICRVASIDVLPQNLDIFRTNLTDAVTVFYCTLTFLNSVDAG